MLPKLIFCGLLVVVQTGGSDGANYDQQSLTTHKLLDLPSFNTKSIVGQPTTINHKSYIEHASPETGSSPRSRSSSHTSGARSSTLLNKAIAEQNAASDPVIQPPSYTDVQVTPPSISSQPVGISPINNANSGIFAAGLFAPGSISSIPSGISSYSNNKDEYLPTGYFGKAFDKINIHVPETISVSVSSSIDDGISSDPVKLHNVNYANDAILSAGEFGTSHGDDVISIPNALSVNSDTGHGAPKSISTAAVPVKVSSDVGLAENSFLSAVGNGAIISTGQFDTSFGKNVVSIPEDLSINSAPDHEAPRDIPGAVPVKDSSSIGLAESSFLSALGTIIENPTALPTPDSITFGNSASTSIEAPVNYASEKVPLVPVVSQSTLSNPSILTSQATIDKYLSTPSSNVFGLLGNGYNSNLNGILSSDILGTPISSIFELGRKELSPNGLFSVSNNANNGNLGVGLASVPVNRNNNDPLKFETTIQHTSPTNAAAPTSLNGINKNNIFNGLIGNKIFGDPIGFPNGLFGSSYNGVNGLGGGNFGADNIFSKYFWR